MQRKFDFGRLILKVLAIGTMTIDHIGAILLPEMSFLRIIGRLAFPIFLYLMILGVESTRNVKAYFSRLLVFALISQIPYFLAFRFEPFQQLNIFFTLVFGGLFAYLLNKGNPLVPVPFLAALLLNSEGGLYGIAFVVCIILLKKNTLFGVLASFLLNFQYLYELNIQAFALLSLLPIILHQHRFLEIERDVADNSKYFSWLKIIFYLYYPLHLTLLSMIRFYLI